MLCSLVVKTTTAIEASRHHWHLEIGEVVGFVMVDARKFRRWSGLLGDIGRLVGRRINLTRATDTTSRATSVTAGATVRSRVKIWR
jgi:hypothetical protein